MHPKKENNSDIHWTIGDTFTKLCDNLTNNDGDIYCTNCKLKLDVKYIALSAILPSGLNKVS